jgi:hypothetical protein
VADPIPFTLKAESCFAWTPKQMLEALIEDIDAGKLVPKGMIVVFTEENPDKSLKVRTWRAQLTRGEEYMYLGISQTDMIR